MSRIHYQSYRGITLIARDLRKNQTPQEKILWRELRKRKQFGYKFLRQHPVFCREEKGWVDFYIADFYCNELKLIIELDGRIHDSRGDYDKERDARLNAKGLQVIRILNDETNNIPVLLNFLEEKIKCRAAYLSDKQ